MITKPVFHFSEYLVGTYYDLVFIKTGASVSFSENGITPIRSHRQRPKNEAVFSFPFVIGPCWYLSDSSTAATTRPCVHTDVCLCIYVQCTTSCVTTLPPPQL